MFVTSEAGPVRPLQFRSQPRRNPVLRQRWPRAPVESADERRRGSSPQSRSDCDRSEPLPRNPHPASPGTSPINFRRRSTYPCLSRTPQKSCTRLKRTIRKPSRAPSRNTRSSGRPFLRGRKARLADRRRRPGDRGDRVVRNRNQREFRGLDDSAQIPAAGSCVITPSPIPAYLDAVSVGLDAGASLSLVGAGRVDRDTREDAG